MPLRWRNKEQCEALQASRATMFLRGKQGAALWDKPEGRWFKSSLRNQNRYRCWYNRVDSGIVIAKQQGSRTQGVRGSYFTEKNIGRISTYKNKRCILGVFRPSCNAFFVVFIALPRDLTQYLYRPIVKQPLFVKRLNNKLMKIYQGNPFGKQIIIASSETSRSKKTPKGKTKIGWLPRVSKYR